MHLENTMSVRAAASARAFWPSLARRSAFRSSLSWLRTAVVAGGLAALGGNVQAATYTATAPASSYKPISGVAPGFNSTYINGGISMVTAQSAPIIGRLQSLNPRVFRYPGGTISNWWNMDTDEVMHGSAAGVHLDNRPKDFINLVDAAGLPRKFNVVLNMLTKYDTTALPVPGTTPAWVASPPTAWVNHLNWQAKMFTSIFPRYLGLNPSTSNTTVFVELGNEFYDAHDTEPVDTATVYPNDQGTNMGAGTHYAVAAHYFIKNLKAAIVAAGGPNFDDNGNLMKFGVVACQKQYASLAAQVNFNKEVADYFRQSSVPQSERPHAYIFHEYVPIQTGAVTASTAQTMVFQELWKQFNYIQAVGPRASYKLSERGYVRNGGSTGDTPSAYGNNSAEIWYTEYNLKQDTNDAIQGTWCHGLAVALMALRFYDVPSGDTLTLPNQHILCHSALGSGNTDYNALRTAAGNRSAIGIALQLVYEAMEQGGSAARVVFNGDTSYTDTVPNLYGVVFKNGSIRRAVIVNMSNSAHTVNFNATDFPTNTGDYRKYIDEPIDTAMDGSSDAGGSIQQTNGAQSSVSIPSHSLVLICTNN